MLQLEYFNHLCYTLIIHQERAGALTNLPNPARWCSEREMWPRTATKGSNSQSAPQPSADNFDGGFYYVHTQTVLKSSGRINWQYSSQCPDCVFSTLRGVQFSHASRVGGVMGVKELP